MAVPPMNSQERLFSHSPQPIRIAPSEFDAGNADRLYWPAFLNAEESDNYFQNIVKALHWQQRTLRVYNKDHLTPRLVAWCADPGIAYSYSGDTTPQQDWPPALIQLKEHVEQRCKARFNGALLNYYRNGDDSMGWHCDDESSLGEQPVIASLSLGAERTFQFRPKPPRTGERIDLTLENGSLLLMSGNTQKFWQHALPKRKRIQQARLNITFRYVHDIENR